MSSLLNKHVPVAAAAENRPCPMLPCSAGTLLAGVKRGIARNQPFGGDVL